MLTAPVRRKARQQAARYCVIFYVSCGVIILFSLVLSVLFAKYFNLWIQAKMTDANVGILELVGMIVPQGEPEHHRPLEDHGHPGRA